MARSSIIFIRKDGEQYSSFDNNGFLAKKPDIPLPERVMESKPILGRDSSVTYDYGTYQDRSVKLNLNFLNHSNRRNLKTFNGIGGKLYFNWQDGFYKVKRITGVLPNDDRGQLKVEITMLIEPFIFLEEEIITITTKGTKVFNDGDEDSRCTVNIFGTGNITFSINENQYAITGLEGAITLNSETLQINNGTDNLGEKVVGDIRKLKIQAGENTISWTGNVTKVVINYSPVLFG